MRAYLSIVFLILCLLLPGCGGSQNVTAFPPPAPTPETPAPPVGSATITLRSEVILAKAIETDIATLKFTTKTSDGDIVFASEPIPKAPVMKVEVPTDSKHVTIEYLNSSEKIAQIWGSPLPDLKDGEEVIIRQPDPDPVDGVVRLEILTPSEVPPNAHQFKAQVVYTDNSVRDVTDSCLWLRPISPAGTFDFTNFNPNAQFTASASFAGFSASQSVRVLNVTPIGSPFLLDGPNLNDSPVTSLLLQGCGDTTQLFTFFEFSDGAIRNVDAFTLFSSENSNIVTVSAQGKVTAGTSGKTNISVTSARRTIRIPVTVNNEPGAALFGNRLEKTTPIGQAQVGPLTVQDMNGDGLGDLIAFHSTGSGEIDLTNLQLLSGSGTGAFGAPIPIALPFKNEAGTTPIVAHGYVTRPTSVGVVGPFVAIGSSKSSQVAIVTRGRNGFVVDTFEVGAPAREIAMIPDSLDTRTRERLFIRTEANTVKLIQLGTGSITDVNIPSLTSTDSLVPITRGRNNALVRGTANSLFVLLLDGSTTSLVETFSLPSNTRLVTLNSVSDARGGGFDALVGNQSQTSLLRFSQSPTGSTFARTEVSGLAQGSRLTPYLLNCGTERSFNLAVSGNGSPLLVQDKGFEALPGLTTLNTNSFTSGDLNEDGFGDLIIREGNSLRAILMGARS